MPKLLFGKKLNYFQPCSIHRALDIHVANYHRMVDHHSNLQDWNLYPYLLSSSPQNVFILKSTATISWDYSQRQRENLVQDI